MHAPSNFVTCLDEEAVGLLFGLARLDVPLAVLVEVVGNPGCLGLPAGFPCALTDSCHRPPAFVASPLFPNGSEYVAKISDGQGVRRPHRLALRPLAA